MPRASSQSSSSKKLGELAVVERIRNRAPVGGGHSALKLGIGDDCAILSPPFGAEILVTTDFSLEGRHFRREWHSPESVGHRTLARGLSDLASMGAKPLAAFLSLALPRSLARDARWLDGFLNGLLGLAREWKVPLAGGDTSESPGDHILADIVLLGTAPAGTALRRSGGRAGDTLYCTGSLGGAAAELTFLPDGRKRKSRDGANHPHLFPSPRLAVGQRLRERWLASACIDLSDGLSTDLAHLCEASGVGAVVNTVALPLHPLAAKETRNAALALALHGGEDYELLFSAPAHTKVPRSIASVTISRIGQLVPRKKGQPQVTLIDDDGAPLELHSAGWEHLR